MRFALVPRALALATGALLLTACATQSDTGASPVPTASESSMSPTPSATPSAVATPTPSATDPAPTYPTPDPRTPVDVLFVTLDVVDGVVESTGIVTGVVEDGGSCTVTLEGPGVAQTAGTTGMAGPVSTYCGLMTVPVSALTPGEWVATLEYSSDGHHGVSGPQIVRIP